MTTATITIPERFKAPCELCHTALDVRDRGVYQHTTGWVMNRSGGGGHGVSLPERQNRWAHRFCVEQAVKGTAAQARLFGD